MAIKARVLRTGFAIGGWRADLEIEGDVLRIAGDGQELEIDTAQVKRWSFNASNGMWALRMKDGSKHYVQTPMASVAPGPNTPDLRKVIGDLLRSHGARGFVVGARKARRT